MNYKFKVGDRVRVTKIDNKNYYSDALYKVGDVGTIGSRGRYDGENDYGVRFDRLEAIDKDPYWFALERWLEPENSVMIFE